MKWCCSTSNGFLGWAEFMTLISVIPNALWIWMIVIFPWIRFTNFVALFHPFVPVLLQLQYIISFIYFFVQTSETKWNRKKPSKVQQSTAKQSGTVREKWNEEKWTNNRVLIQWNKAKQNVDNKQIESKHKETTRPWRSGWFHGWWLPDSMTIHENWTWSRPKVAVGVHIFGILIRIPHSEKKIDVQEKHWKNLWHAQVKAKSATPSSPGSITSPAISRLLRLPFLLAVLQGCQSTSLCKHLPQQASRHGIFKLRGAELQWNVKFFLVGGCKMILLFLYLALARPWMVLLVMLSGNCTSIDYTRQ